PGRPVDDPPATGSAYRSPAPARLIPTPGPVDFSAGPFSCRRGCLAGPFCTALQAINRLLEKPQSALQKPPVARQYVLALQALNVPVGTIQRPNFRIADGEWRPLHLCLRVLQPDQQAFAARPQYL